MFFSGIGFRLRSASLSTATTELTACTCAYQIMFKIQQKIPIQLSEGERIVMHSSATVTWALYIFGQTPVHIKCILTFKTFHIVQKLRTVCYSSTRYLRIGGHVYDDGLRVGHAQLAHCLQLIALSINLHHHLIKSG